MDDFVYQTKIKVHNCEVKPCLVAHPTGAYHCCLSIKQLPARSIAFSGGKV